MSQNQAKNAIVRRVDRLRAAWLGAKETTPLRLWVLRLRADETALVEGLIAIESDERTAETDDVFARLDTPFEDETRHGHVLADALALAFEDDRAALVAEGVDASWERPRVEGSNDLDDLFATAGSLAQFYVSEGAHFALVLTPSAVASAAGWLAWLQRLAQAAGPEALRFIVLDNRDAPALTALSEGAPTSVLVHDENFDMPSAYEELAAEAGRMDTPGARLRLLLVKLARATAPADKALRGRLAADALAITAAEGWPELGCVVHTMVGSAALAAGDSQGALLAFDAAEKQADQAVDKGIPGGKKLVLQTKLAQAAALYKDARYQEAAAVYLSAVPVAEHLEDKRMTLDTLRMAAHCNAEVGLDAEAQPLAERAVSVGEGMSEDERATSTLAYAGDTLLRVSSTDQHAAIHARLTVLLGPGWRAETAHTPPGPAPEAAEKTP